MIVYKYDDDGFYEFPHDCQPCPKTGGWLYPPRYLTSAPPEPGEWKRAKADGKKWALVDDNRGRQAWYKETGEPVMCITEHIPEALTTTAPPDPCYHKYDGSWKIDAAKKTAYDAQKEIQADEALIAAEMRKMAIAALGDKLKVVNK